MQSQFPPGYLRDLYYEGLTPIVSLSSNVKIPDNSGTSIPLLRGKTMQWLLNLSSGNITKIFLKLGTCGRFNHCQLVLSILPEQNQTPVARAILDGTTAQDNQWTEFVFDHPIEPGKYRCQLQSPDADDHNTLFLWLTVVINGEL